MKIIRWVLAGLCFLSISTAQKRLRIQNLKDKKMESKKRLQIEKIAAVKKNGFKDIKEGQKRLKGAVNTLRFYNIPMDKKIQDNETMTTFVKESLATCNSLIKKE